MPVRRNLVLAVAVLLVFGGLLSGVKRTIASTVETAPAATEVAPLSSRGSIAIPVLGITREELRDTFGAARGPARTHQAIDILSDRGTPAIAAVDGSILKLYESGAGGLTIYLVDEDDALIYYYAHLDRYEPGLSEGDEVRQGDVIGYVGTTGNAPESTPHLHFSIEHLPPTGEWWKGEAMNPYPILMSEGYTER